MALFKCKMCGGALEINTNDTIVTCEYCGTQQTLPKLNDEKRVNMYDRANHFRRNNEFDKAIDIYEKILNDDDTDAEAYWSLVLCRFGIDYVEDPATKKRVPTINRAQYTSIFDDDNYKSALNYADENQRALYEEEAKTINEIQKGILAISQKEDPFDVFICYKETDNDGKRTHDSVLANDLYYQLKQEGLKVFFARITLEDKLGSAYEPYIFAALNSSKVMVVLGTKPEYFNAVWVKNEWSRYLALIKQGQKKMLIPAYRDMDPYNLPEEFSHLQAQDMSKLGFMQDLIRGIKKILNIEKPKPQVVEKEIINGVNITALLRRAFLDLEDGNWEDAVDRSEKVLDQDAENAEAYLIELMADLEVHTRADLGRCHESFEHNDIYQKVVRFSDDKLKTELQGYLNQIEEIKKQEYYQNLLIRMDSVSTESDFIALANEFDELGDYYDSVALKETCVQKAEEERIRVEEANRRAEEERLLALELAENARKDGIYDKAVKLKFKWTKNDLKASMKLFESIIDWKDSREQIEKANNQLRQIEEQERLAKLRKERRRKRTIAIWLIILTLIAALCGAFLYYEYILKQQLYDKAEACIAEQKYDEAIDYLNKVFGHEGKETLLNKAILLKDGKYSDVIISEGISGFIIPDGVTEIRARAFENCYTLSYITIPASVKTIGSNAFKGCTNLLKVNYLGTIDQWAEINFVNQDSNPLKEAEKLFIDGKLINEIKLTTATKISDYAFYGSTSIKTVVVPSSVKSIGKESFVNCTSLVSMTLPYLGNTLNDTDNGNLGYLFGGASNLPSSLKSITLTGGTRVGFEAFKDCKYLTNITVPETVTAFDAGAFKNCTSLTYVNIPKNLTKLGDSAFENCSSLPIDIILPDTVTYVGDSVFKNCSKITKVQLPNTLTTIGEGMFMNCTWLTEVNIPENIINIPANAFNNCKALRSIVIPNGVKTIGEYAFASCILLTTIEIPKGVNTIGSYAFAWCSSINSITIPSSVEYMGSYVFYGCYWLDVYCDMLAIPSNWHSNWDDSVNQVIVGTLD